MFDTLAAFLGLLLLMFLVCLKFLVVTLKLFMLTSGVYGLILLWRSAHSLIRAQLLGLTMSLGDVLIFSYLMVGFVLPASAVLLNYTGGIYDLCKLVAVIVITAVGAVAGLFHAACNREDARMARSYYGHQRVSSTSYDTETRSAV